MGDTAPATSLRCQTFLLQRSVVCDRLTMMNENSSPNNEELQAQRDLPVAFTKWDKLLESPDVQKAIAELISKAPELVESNIKSKTVTTRGITRNVLYWSGILILAIVAPVSVLTAIDKLSSDAAAFLFGAIIGAAFTFVRSFFGSRE